MKRGKLKNIDVNRAKVQNTFYAAALHSLVKCYISLVLLQNPKRGSGFPNKYSQTDLKNVLLTTPLSLLGTRIQFFEWPRSPTWQYCLISLIWHQEQYPIIKNHAVWKPRFAEFLPSHMVPFCSALKVGEIILKTSKGEHILNGKMF